MARDAFVEREPYLRRVLDAFEQGRIEPYEYTRRVLAINAASSVEQMAAVADAGPDHLDGASGKPPRVLDPVDLALLRSRPGAAPNRSTSRYAALVFVFIVFAVLLGLGLWLGVHAHAPGSPSGTVRSVVTMGGPVPG